jgi:hypothetical protein
MGVGSAILGGLVVIVILMVIGAYIQSESKVPQQQLPSANQPSGSDSKVVTKPGSELSQPAAAPPVVVKPRPKSVNDCGYDSADRGWYDAQGQGVKNDFCRRVGDGSWFACQLAGKSPADGPGWHLTPKGAMDHLIGKDFDAGVNGIEQCSI